MPRVGFEPTIPVFEWAKAVHALDRAATVIGSQPISDENKHFMLRCRRHIRVIAFSKETIE
jgi:hypothetical protein